MAEMVWSEHRPDTRYRRPGWSPATASMVRRKSGGLPYLSIILREEAWQALGLKAGQNVKVYCGHGEHQGRLRLLPHDDGASTFAGRRIAQSGRLLLTLNLGRFHGLPETPRTPTPIQWETQPNGMIEFTLPRWHEPTTGRDMSPRAIANRLGRAGQ